MEGGVDVSGESPGELSPVFRSLELFSWWSERRLLFLREGESKTETVLKTQAAIKIRWVPYLEIPLHALQFSYERSIE